jgi:hypothetical protein
MFSNMNAKNQKANKKQGDNEKCLLVLIINHINMVRLFVDASQSKI